MAQTTVDPNIKSLVQAIGATETGPQSTPQAYQQKGASGEFGRYQFMPDTFKQYAGKYLGDPTAQPTVENQNKIAYSFVQEKKNAGFNPAQIASMWNAGEGKPDAYKENYTGTNAEGVKYDTPGYVQKVSQYYEQYKQQNGVAQQPSPTTSDTQTPATKPGQFDVGAKTAADTGFLGTNPNDSLTGKILNNSITRGIENFFPGKEIGEDIGTLGGYALSGNKDQYDTSAPTPLQAAGDVAQGALMVAAPEAGQESSTGVKIATQAGIGGAFGAAHGVASGDSAGQVAQDAGVGAAIGGVTGGVLEGAGSLIKSFGSKSAEDIASMARDPNVTQKDINGLSSTEQEQYFREKSTAVSDDAKAQRTARQADAQATVQQADQDVKAFQQQAGEAASSTAESLKAPAQQLMRDQSQRYVQLTQEAAATAGGNALEKAVPVEDLSKAIDDKFADTDVKDNSSIRSSLKSQLGLSVPDVPTKIDPETQLPIIPTESTPEKTITNQQILDKAKEIMQTVSKASRTGGTTYSPADYEAMQKYSFLMDQLGENGIDMTEANKFWKNWAPTRDRIVREVKPWDDTGVKGSPFTKTLIRSENTSGTALQTASKIDAQKFVGELEDKLGLPKGSLGKDVRDALQGADKAKLSKETAQEILSEAKDQIAKDKSKALKTMSRQKYTAAKVARNRKIIQGIVLTVLGVEALKKVPEAAKAIGGLI